MAYIVSIYRQCSLNFNLHYMKLDLDRDRNATTDTLAAKELEGTAKNPDSVALGASANFC